MAQIPGEIKDILMDYLNSLSNEIDVKSAILFGSYSTGEWTPESDIDIAIFSDYFSRIGRTDAIAFLLDKTLEYNIDIQPLAFDGKDLENYHDNPFVNEIVTCGIKLM